MESIEKQDTKKLTLLVYVALIIFKALIFASDNVAKI